MVGRQSWSRSSVTVGITSLLNSAKRSRTRFSNLLNVEFDMVMYRQRFFRLVICRRRLLASSMARYIYPRTEPFTRIHHVEQTGKSGA